MKQLLAAALMSVTLVLAQAGMAAAATTERALYIHYVHTKETARIVFKRNGQYVQSGLNELNYFLRDWRRNEPTKMDPRLFDLIWEVYQDVGASQPVTVVSAYRSPKTNAMLRETSSGVAENSQHMRGNAMDFYIPGVPLTKLRAAAMRRQVGGVGYYPTSGSPFVHLDTGSVRAWPRLTRAQLKDIFPDGRTLHVPTDGKPLSQEGYQLAMADWKRCHASPCGGSSGTRVAEASGGGKTLMDMFFGGDKPQQAQAPAAASAPARAPTPAPAPMQVAIAQPEPAAALDAPMPALRPASLGGASAAPAIAAAPAELVIPFSTKGSAPLDPSEMVTPRLAPTPLLKSASLQVATASALPAGDAVTAIAAFSAPVPQPRVIMTAAEEQPMMTAYLPPIGPNTNAERTLEALIDRETTAALAPAPASRQPIAAGLTGISGLRTASLGPSGANGLAGLFSTTFGSTQQVAPIAAALADHIAKRPSTSAMRSPELIAPDLEHVAEIFLTPVPASSSHFAEIWDHDEADFDPTTELGRFVTVMGVGDFAEGLPHNRFVVAKPLALASN